MSIECKDMIVLLPGISGSVLQKNGKDLWAPSAQAIFGAIGGSLQNLRLEGDDPDLDDLGDGITAPRLVPDVHIIPGLVKIDGYSGISNMIMETFKVEKGNLFEKKPANYFEFPYDWRRDNRVSARKLKKLIDDKLHLWRKETPYKNAKVILMAHSMGGLVSRHYLEVLEGWRDCKALITFGTPYRGSVNALDNLANGYKQLGIDITEPLRSFTSVYQLLPIYEMLVVNGSYKRVAETENVPGVNKAKAKDALIFHRDIEKAVTKNSAEEEYQKNFNIMPIIGTEQATSQAAIFENGKIRVSKELPGHIAQGLGGGDGTVPRVSATPIELSDVWSETFVAEKHASIQNNIKVLGDLRGRLSTMLSGAFGNVRGRTTRGIIAPTPAISLELDDVYTTQEPINFRAEIVNAETNAFGEIIAVITSLTQSRQVLEQPLTKADDGSGIECKGA